VRDGPPRRPARAPHRSSVARRPRTNHPLTREAVPTAVGCPAAVRRRAWSHEDPDHQHRAAPHDPTPATSPACAGRGRLRALPLAQDRLGIGQSHRHSRRQQSARAPLRDDRRKRRERPARLARGRARAPAHPAVGPTGARLDPRGSLLDRHRAAHPDRRRLPPPARRSPARRVHGTHRRRCRSSVPARVGVHRRLHRIHRPGARSRRALRPVRTCTLGTAVAGPDLRAGAAAGPHAWCPAGCFAAGFRDGARPVGDPSAVGHRIEERTHLAPDRRPDERLLRARGDVRRPRRDDARGPAAGRTPGRRRAAPTSPAAPRLRRLRRPRVLGGLPDAHRAR